MRLEFVPVEDFYFALTLCVKTLEEISDSELILKVHGLLRDRFDQPSTVASAQQNTFNYVFRVLDYDNSPAPQLVVSIADWQDKLRLSSDFGWTLDGDRKPVRTDKFPLRASFNMELKQHLSQTLQLPLT
ncbi:MAG TPA: hypothetical protein V6D19_21455 [Stenomitos sp.]